jgi:hypothetical protein
VRILFLDEYSYWDILVKMDEQNRRRYEVPLIASILPEKSCSGFRMSSHMQLYMRTLFCCIVVTVTVHHSYPAPCSLRRPVSWVVLVKCGRGSGFWRCLGWRPQAVRGPMSVCFWDLEGGVGGWILGHVS